MKPPVFEYHAPDRLEEVLDLLTELGDEAKILAGGQSLVPMLSFRLAQPAHLIDINRLPDLDRPQRTPTGWRIPALVRQRTVERSADFTGAHQVVPDALTHVAHPQIRNRGTICGSLAHADPAAEMPTIMVTLDASMTVASSSGTRVIGADDFFQFHLTTALDPAEMLVAVDIPDAAPRTYTGFLEFAPRHGDFCLAGVAVSVTYDESGAVAGCRLVAAGVAPTPLRLRATEALLIGTTHPDADIEAGALARTEVDPVGDVHASSTYRRGLVAALTRRVLVAVRAQAAESAR